MRSHGDRTLPNRGQHIDIRPALWTDAEGIAGIFNHYIAQTVVTFEEQILTPDDMVERMEAVSSDRLPWLVAERNGEIVGYANAIKWKERSAYRFSTETSVYVGVDHTGKGIGTSLYRELIRTLRSMRIRSVFGGILLPNDASQRLHEKLGFKKVAHFREIGFKFERWIDVGYWQLEL